MNKKLNIYRILCYSNRRIEYGRFSHFYVKAKTLRAAYNVFINSNYDESSILYVEFYHENAYCGIICIN